MLSLKEIDRSSTNAQEKQLQQRFEEESHHFTTVDVVSRSSGTTSALEVFVARSTAKRGYLQVAQLATQSFSVFLTHVDDLPMEASIRCLRFAMCLSTPTNHSVPSPLSTPGTSDVFPCPVVYSLDFSNQVLVSDLNSGAVRVLDEFPCRPSYIFTDGSIVAVGDGRGRVHAYRGSAVAPHLWVPQREGHVGAPLAPSVAHGVMWSAAVSLHSVTLIDCVHHAYIIAATSNYNVFVLDASTGVMLSSLIAESSPLRYVLSATGPLALGGPTEVSLHFDSGIVSTFQCVQPSGGATWSLTSVSRRATAQRCGARIWSPKHDCMIDLCGTTAGQVQLFQKGGASSAATDMMSQVDVNDGVVSIHVVPRPEDPLAITVVCTSGGSLWQWTMAELDLTAEVNVELEDPRPAVDAPAAAVNTTNASVDMQQHIDALVDHVVQPQHQAPNQQQTGGPSHKGGDVDPVVIDLDEHDVGAAHPSLRHHVQEHDALLDDEAVSIAATQDSAVPSSVALTAITQNTTREEMMQQRYRPNHNVRFAQTIGEASPPAGHHNANVAGTSSATTVVAHVHEDDVAAKERHHSTSPPSTRAVVRRSSSHPDGNSSAVSIPGLTQGRRWDPRRVEATLTRGAADGAANMRAPFSVPIDQSTAAVEAEDARLAAEEFDYAAYAAAHPLEANALRHMNPIRGTTYHANEALYSALNENVDDRGDSAERALFASPRAVTSPTAAAAAPPRGDDLVDATFLKFAQKRDAQHRKRQLANSQGPHIRDHMCHDLLVAPPVCAPAAIFFAEYQVPLSEPPLLTMPMPLPPSAVSAL